MRFDGAKRDLKRPRIALDRQAKLGVVHGRIRRQSHIPQHRRIGLGVIQSLKAVRPPWANIKIARRPLLVAGWIWIPLTCREVIAVP
jgi:hypothetical protein